MTEPIAELLVALGSGNLMPAEMKQFNSEEFKDEPSRRPIAKFVFLARTHKLDEALKEKEVGVIFVSRKFRLYNQNIFLYLDT